MFLREHLYVDTEKTRGFLAQLTGGVEEEIQNAVKQSKATDLGLKGVAHHGVTWGTDEQVSKSLGDAIFPTLEELLESEGLLTDLSERLADGDAWRKLPSEVPPGSIIRVSAPASLFDARYLAATFAGFAATAQGATHFGMASNGTQGGAQSNTQRKNPKGSSPRPPKPAPSHASELEDGIPDFGTIQGIASEDMRALVRVARGMFKPGLHMVFKPTGAHRHSITVRLQEGRSYLDSDPDVLFARFGIAAQVWTVVGTVGHYAHKSVLPPKMGNLVQGESIDRLTFTDGINSLLEYFGRIGFVDLPRYPGFSLVPIAVYRTTGTSPERPAS